jgi:predicted ATP-dependent Lon-type protease
MERNNYYSFKSLSLLKNIEKTHEIMGKYKWILSNEERSPNEIIQVQQKIIKHISYTVIKCLENGVDEETILTLKTMMQLVLEDIYKVDDHFALS